MREAEKVFVGMECKSPIPLQSIMDEKGMSTMRLAEIEKISYKNEAGFVKLSVTLGGENFEAAAKFDDWCEQNGITFTFGIPDGVADECVGKFLDECVEDFNKDTWGDLEKSIIEQAAEKGLEFDVQALRRECRHWDEWMTKTQMLMAMPAEVMTLRDSVSEIVTMADLACGNRGESIDVYIIKKNDGKYNAVTTAKTQDGVHWCSLSENAIDLETVQDAKRAAKEAVKSMGRTLDAREY